jgi:shikimate kinase
MAVGNRIFLVGPMGAGKTTIGRLLARSLRLDFVDSDSEIEESTGADIPWIFDVEGEERFRDREQEALEMLTLRDRTVLATGGGAVLRLANRRVLSARGFVVYLYAPLEEQIRRTGGDRKRPLLAHGDPAQTLKELMALRDPLYREVADLVIESDSSSPRSVAQRVLSQLP